VAGAALAIGGMALQGLLRNPLAEPYLLGVSSGAGVGVLLGMALTGWFAWAGWFAEPLLAFAGAMVTCALVYLLAQRRGRIDPLSLILSGVIINSFNGAVMLVIYLYIDPHRIAGFAQWMMGRVPDMVDVRLLMVTAGLVFAGWAVMLLAAAKMNVLSLGDSVATSSGVAVHSLRVVTFVCVGMMTAAAVALAGPIGFLGLIVPHICRMVVGPDLRKGIIVSGIVGAVVLVGADMLCRVVAPLIGVSLIPVGIVTALAGGPFFIVLLSRKRGGAL
jgi:iron complex transport system permease protein